MRIGAFRAINTADADNVVVARPTGFEKGEDIAVCCSDVVPKLVHHLRGCHGRRAAVLARAFPGSYELISHFATTPFKHKFFRKMTTTEGVLAEELKAAIRRKQAKHDPLLAALTKKSLLRLDKPVLLSQQELFTVAAAECTLDAMKASSAPCCVWKPSARYSTLQRCESTLAAELANTNDNKGPRSIFEIQGLSVKVSDEAVALLDGLDIFDEGALLSMGSTFTPFHVEDYCLQNMATLQRVHKNASDACKVWFITTDPIKGQDLRRAHYREVCMEVIEGADYVIVQQEGQTIYVPPLAYHAVLTVYSENVVAVEERFTLLCGTFFADVRRGSLWRESISTWMRGHQTGVQHGDKKSVLKKYAKYVKSPAVRRGRSKRQRGKERASKAIAKRWKE
jgi:hypothetical protein